eukprot:719808_1
MRAVLHKFSLFLHICEWALRIFQHMETLERHVSDSSVEIQKDIRDIDVDRALSHLSATLSVDSADGYKPINANITHMNDLRVQEMDHSDSDPNQHKSNTTIYVSHIPMVATTHVATPVGTEDTTDDYHIHTPRFPNIQNQHSDIHNRTLFTNNICSVEFMGRCFLIILNIFLLIISIAYYIGQLFDSTLHLVKPCEPKAIEDIWANSYNAGLSNNGDVEITEASQYGKTNESCFTTKTLSTHTETLWYSNVYTTHRTEPRHYQSTLFLSLAVYCSCIILYNAYTLVADCLSASTNQLHTKSRFYRYFMENQTQTIQPPHIDSWLRRKIRDLYEYWRKYMETDTTGWIIRGVMSEILEITIQTQALAHYNGYNILDPRNKDGVYLANQPKFIVIFAVILSFNCLGSGVLWCAYSLLTKYCHGLLFKLLLFCVDEMSDLFYTLFPFVMILFDPYNDPREWDIWVLLAQLNTKSTFVAFLSAFMPLLILCTKSLLIVRSARRQLADRCYSRWKLLLDLTQEKDDEQATYQAKLAGYKVNLAALQRNQKEIYDGKGNLVFSLDKAVGQMNWIQTGTEDEVSTKRQCILIAISLIYIVYGVGVLWFVIRHLQHAQHHCAMVNESQFFVNGELNINSTMLKKEQTELLQSNPELFFWNKCLYKVYPIFIHHPCQCRVLVMDWEHTLSSSEQRDTYFNLTQPIILSNMLRHWFSLEKFRTNGKENQKDISIIDTTTIRKSMFVAQHMKAFEWTIAKIDCIERGISEWKQLEYFKLKDVTIPFGIPNDFAGLQSMKYLSLEGNGLQTFPDTICNLTNLQVLDINLESNIKSIPKCISNLVELKQLILDNCLLLQYIPLSIFKLPKLVTLSLFHGLITLQSLIEYNVPNNIDTNDSNAALEWLRDELVINSNIKEYYLALNPICNENVTWLGNDHAFMNQSCHYPCMGAKTVLQNQFCPPRLLGDGTCDTLCNNGDCNSDFGDCVQLCFAPQLTNCTYDLYTNDVCDEGCDNDYCVEYEDVSFETKWIYNSSGKWRAADLWHCEIDYTLNKPTCEDSNSSYVSHEMVDEYNEYIKCEPDWIGDSDCDDSCRTNECDQDGGDCALGSTCIANSCKYIYDAWLLFVGFEVYNVNISYFCNSVYPKAIYVMNTNPLENVSCENGTDIYDFNRDGYVNFREFAFLGYWFAGGGTQKGKQLNCSECIGMEYYNVNNNDQITSTPISTCDMN